MVKENISQEFRLKNKYEGRNYFLKKIKQNEFMSEEHKKVCTTLNYIEHVLIKLLKLHDVFQFLILLLYLVFL